MYKEISHSDAVRAVMDADQTFTHSGASALISHLEATESEYNRIEFDPIAIRCEYTQYATATIACNDLGIDYEGSAETDHAWSEEELETSALGALYEKTLVLIVEDGVVVENP